MILEYAAARSETRIPKKSLKLRFLRIYEQKIRMSIVQHRAMPVRSPIGE
jgi:hypothetical protein